VVPSRHGVKVPKKETFAAAAQVTTALVEVEGYGCAMLFHVIASILSYVPLKLDHG
jgi:hypothetical protein